VKRSGLRVVKDVTAPVLSAIESMGRKHVVVGIPATEDQRRVTDEEDIEGPIGNAALYYLHDHGSPLNNIPARETLSPGIADAREHLALVLGQAARQAFTTKGAIERGLEAAGLIAQTSVKKRIIAGTDLEPLAERTLAARRRRGIESEKPLIRTAQMLNSITYEVREK
jgi:secreted protein with Ig-like and vWFA domain